MNYKILLKQHIGAPCVPSVKEGDSVKCGSVLAIPGGLGAPIHSPFDGTVSSITEDAILLEVSEAPSDCLTDSPFIPLEGNSEAELLAASGLVGMGGAGFPTSVKCKADLKGGYILVNAAECEPLLHHNIQQLETQTAKTIEGIKILMRLCNAGKGVIAIKQKHRKTLYILNKLCAQEENISYHLLPDLYPMGEERAVVREVLGKLLSPTDLPSAADSVVINAETVLRVAEAVQDRRPCISKNVSVAGKLNGGTHTRVFMDVPIGTTVGELIERAGGIDGAYGEIIMGGPFTGRPVSPDTPITKTTGGILVTAPFENLNHAKTGLLLCACGGSQARMEDIASKMNADVVCVQKCKQAVEIKGALKCENPGNCPGQAQKCLNFKKAGCTDIIIGNCSDCTNTVMGSAPKLALTVHHQTDHVFDTVGLQRMRHLTKSKKVEEDTTMSISEETAKAHKNDPAVLCCRAEAGTVLSSHNLEDPAIFDDLVDSGLLNLDGCLTIGQVLGATLTKTCDSLSPLTEDAIEKIMTEEEEAPAKEEPAKEPVTAPSAPLEAAAPTAAPVSVAGGVLKISIGEGKDIHIELPLGGVAAPVSAAPAAVVEAPSAAPAVIAEPADPEPKLIRTLTRHHYKITEVKRGPETKIEGTTLYIREGIEADAIKSQALVHDLKIEIITPELYHTYSETIMDVQPIAVKEKDSEIGSGITRVIDGAIIMVTGTDENGVQIGEFGSSEGYLDENIMWNRPGAPDKGEIFIKTQVTIKAGTNMERPGPLAAHSATDVITHEIREALKKLDDEALIVEKETYEQYRRPGKKKVVIVKEIMGQGAMHDNLILPQEPVGVLGAKPNVDLGNVPVMVSPLEVLDGCIHALTCIGPASKEMSRHYWREPLVLEALFDPELDLCGVLLVGSPQINSEKFYVSKRVGMTCEALDVDGAFVTTEGFGNNHIDFASHIEQIGMRGISVVGLSFCAKQGALVVGNKYMTHMVDNNKSEGGIENEILANNTLCHEDAIRAIYMLKAQMGGCEVKAPEKKWNPAVKENNLELISNVTGKPITPVLNETSLPMSQKRKEKYS